MTKDDDLWAVTVYHRTQKPTVWCFNIAEEFALAMWHLKHGNIPHLAHHGLTRQNGPFKLGHGPDKVFLEMSGGFNDHEELLNCLRERKEL